MPEKQKLRRIMEHITDFDFTTPPALAFKHELRRWYYGEQDEKQARRLLTQFEGLFSGNVLIDVVGSTLAAYVTQSPLDLLPSQRLALVLARPGAIIGRSIRAYSLTGDGCGAQTRQESAQRMADVLDAAEAKVKRERLWRGENNVSLFSALISLVGIASLLLGVWRLLGLVLEAWRVGSLTRFITGLPICDTAGETMAWLYSALFAASVLCLAALLRPMVCSVLNGLRWTFILRRRLNLRAGRLTEIRRALSDQGLEDYFQRLEAAAAQLRDQSWDTPRSQDPSAALLGSAGLNQIFRDCPIRPLPRWRSGKPLAQEVPHVKSLLWLLILCATSVFLWRQLGA